MPSCLEQDEELKGAVLHALMLEPSAWVHRRVELLDVLDDVSVRRRVSIDLTLEGDLDAFSPIGAERIGLLPLTLLRKEPLRNFDLRDQDGRPLPMLTKAENGRLAAASLIVHAEGILDQALPCEIESALRLIATGEAETALDELHSWNARANTPSDPHRDQWKQLLTEDPFLDYAHALAENFILIAVCELDLDQRLIFKFEYDEPFGEEEGISWWQRLAVRVGWRKKTIVIHAPGVSFGSSYHFEMLAPPDLEIDAARLDFDPGRPGEGPVEPILDDDRERTHLYVSGLSPNVSGEALVFLRHRRDSYLSAAFMTGLLITMLVGIGLTRLDRIADADQRESAAAILLIVPTLLAAYIVRPGEHRLAARVLWGVRTLVVVAGACAIVAAGLLAGVYEDPALHCIWRWDLAVSALTSAGLLVSLLLPRPTQR